MAEETTLTAAPAPEATVTTTEAVVPAVKKKKVKRSVPTGQVHVLATFNNTIVTLTDPNGNVIAWSMACDRSKS